MEINKEVIEIDLDFILKRILNKKLLIIFVGLFFACGMFVYTKYIKIPVYQSTTKIYSVNNYDVKNITYQDLQIGSNLVKDYEQIILSKDVLSKVIDDIKLNLSEDALFKKITITSPKDTRIIEITVTDKNPKLASDIANSLRKKSIEKIKDVTKIKEITLIEEAKASNLPISFNLNKNLIFSFFAGSFLVISFIVLKELIDDRVKTAKDIEEVMNLALLATIPKENKGK